MGRVVNPLAQPREGQGLIAADGRSLILSAGLSVVDIEDKGGIAAHEARKRVHSTQLDVAMTGYAPGFKDVNDQTRKDLTKAELIAFPCSRSCCCSSSAGPSPRRCRCCSACCRSSARCSSCG